MYEEEVNKTCTRAICCFLSPAWEQSSFCRPTDLISPIQPYPFVPLTLPLYSHSCLPRHISLIVLLQQQLFPKQLTSILKVEIGMFLQNNYTHPSDLDSSITQKTATKICPTLKTSSCICVYYVAGCICGGIHN